MRYRLVGLLSEGARTIASLASELDTSADTIADHAEALRELGVLQAHESIDGAVAYELVRDPVLYDTAWSQLPVEARRAAAAAAVTQMSAAATAAVDRGGFDRDDVHITRTTVHVDDARWGLIRRVMDGTLHALGDLEEQPPPKGDTTFHATAIMMLFSDERTTPSVAVRRSVSADDAGGEPAVRRCWELVEDLHDLLTTTPVDWQRVENMAGQLRLLARAFADGPVAAAGPGARTSRRATTAGSPTGEDARRAQGAVLDTLLAHHPAPTSVDELALLLDDDAAARDAMDALVDAGLAYRTADLAWATHAALRCAALFDVTAPS